MTRNIIRRLGYATWTIGGLLFIALLYGINQVLATPISLVQVLVLTFIYLSIYGIWLQLYRLLALRRFYTAVALLVLMLIAVGPYVYFCVYGLLPWLGEPLHRADVPFDRPQFLARLVSGMVVTAIYAGVVYLLAALRRKGRQRKAALKSHFLRNLMTATKNYASTHPGPKGVEAMQAIVALVEYPLWIGEKELTLVDWRREWAQLTHLANLMERVKGGAILQLQPPEREVPGMIPPLVWLTLVENALIHGDYGVDRPVRVVLRYQRRKLYFHCINAYTAASRQQEGTGQGWIEVRQRIGEKYVAKDRGLRMMDSGTSFHVVLMTGIPIIA